MPETAAERLRKRVEELANKLATKYYPAEGARMWSDPTEAILAGMRAALEEGYSIADEWPLSPKNMEDAERWAKHGWSNAVASATRVGVGSNIRSLIRSLTTELEKKKDGM